MIYRKGKENMNAPVELHARVTAQGREVIRPSSLRRSDDIVEDAEALRTRLMTDGYLYLPGYLDVSEVRAARLDLLGRLEPRGWLSPGTPTADGVAGPEAAKRVIAEIAAASPPLQHLLYGGRMADLYARIFGESIRHFDYTWLRAMPPGSGSKPHMDAVFMNRGTPKLLTAWTPLGDIDRRLGGLAILDRSPSLTELQETYGRRDVDAYCSNHEGTPDAATADGPAWTGTLSDDPVALADDLERHWLTTDYGMGDLLTFPLFTVHCGLDNNTDRLRLSCDARYQPASEPADPRWIGVDPSRHSARSKRGLIC